MRLQEGDVIVFGVEVDGMLPHVGLDREWVVEESIYHPPGSDHGIPNAYPAFTSYRARLLNRDGSYSETNQAIEFTLVRHYGLAVDPDNVTVVRRMRRTFV